MPAESESLYTSYFVDRGFERIEMFELLASCFSVKRALYPGSFVHISPSFVIPSVTYVDSDRQARRFFESSAALDLVAARKRYEDDAEIGFHAAVS